jgi:hypothetical protein
MKISGSQTAFNLTLPTSGWFASDYDCFVPNNVDLFQRLLIGSLHHEYIEMYSTRPARTVSRSRPYIQGPLRRFLVLHC